MKVQRFLSVFVLSLVLLAGCTMVVDPNSQPQASSQAAPAATVTSTGVITVAEVSVPFEAIQIIQEYAPGAWSPPHIHGGSGMGTIISGEVTVRKGPNGEEETVYGPGEFFNETVGEVMYAGNAGQETARMAVLFLLPEGAALTTPVEGTPMADMPPGPTVLSRNSMTITENLGTFEAIQIIQEYDPDAWSPPHVHGGSGMGTVIEGEVTVRKGPNGEEETVHGPGEFFNETVGEIMYAGNAGQEQVKMAVLFLLPQGATLTTPIEGTPMADMPPGPTIISRNSMTITTATE
jgi:quercetin dioxygenase-like cupin family protein